MIGTKRSDLEIALDILRVLKEDGRKTRIMYGANLSYRMLMRYLAGLEARGYIERDGDLYRVTPAGADLVDELERLYARLQLPRVADSADAP